MLSFQAGCVGSDDSTGWVSECSWIQSQLCHLLAVWPQARHVISLHLNSLLWKTGGGNTLHAEMRGDVTGQHLIKQLDAGRIYNKCLLSFSFQWFLTQLFPGGISGTHIPVVKDCVFCKHIYMHNCDHCMMRCENREVMQSRSSLWFFKCWLKLSYLKRACLPNLQNAKLPKVFTHKIFKSCLSADFSPPMIVHSSIHCFLSICSSIHSYTHIYLLTIYVSAQLYILVSTHLAVFLSICLFIHLCNPSALIYIIISPSTCSSMHPFVYSTYNDYFVQTLVQW